MSEFIEIPSDACADDPTQQVLNIRHREDFVSLKVAYEGASNENKVSFTFEGNELLTHYAKYLIEYLEGKGADNFPSRGGSA
jgi:hypothetical protein